MLGLLIATAAAFAITEGLKLTKSPITGLHVLVGQFSPRCGCQHARATISVSLRQADDVTVDVVSAGRNRVARLVDNRFTHARWNAFSWNGRDESGAVARDGTYRFQVKLARQHRTILFPNPFRLDTKPPTIVSARALRPTISPDGDGQSDSTKIQYRLSEPAHAILYVLGRRLTVRRFTRPQNTLTWYGNRTADGGALPPGTYRLQLGARDVAGNVTPPSERATIVVRVRYIALRHRRIVVTAATRFGVGVDTDARSYEWRLGSRGGRSSAQTLVVRAPAVRGRYRLVLTENGRSAAALVIVRPRR